MPVFVRTSLGCLVLVAGLGACTPNRGPGEINDPYEEQNRAQFVANSRIDRMLGGGGEQDGPDIPRPLLLAVSNAGNNLDAPGVAVNHLLQGHLGDAVHTSLRFALNSTIGILGIFDPARAMGLDERDTDFGETLHVWGAPEGAYLVLPVTGPSTERDAAGMVVDTVMNPLNFILPTRERIYTLGVSVAGKAAKRIRFGDSIDSVLYESADPYAQARSIYLQNRRFELRGEADGAQDYVDPYAGLDGGQEYVDPYAGLDGE